MTRQFILGGQIAERRDEDKGRKKEKAQDTRIASRFSALAHDYFHCRSIGLFLIVSH
jgi:hypothetical protein